MSKFRAAIISVTLAAMFFIPFSAIPKTETFPSEEQPPVSENSSSAPESEIQENEKDLPEGSFRIFDLETETVLNVPLDRILIESESPFMVPAEFRNKRNMPAYVPSTAKFLAEMLDMDLEQLAQMGTFNIVFYCSDPLYYDRTLRSSGSATKTFNCENKGNCGQHPFHQQMKQGTNFLPIHR